MGSSVERKVVTILFCDLVGFTATFDLADPEDVRDALATYHATVSREIERFGGVVEKYIGDAVMAVYGAPVAHEDDAQRALLSALRIPPAIEVLNESQPELNLQVRIGVETGEAVVAVGADRTKQGIAVGDVVSTASRLQTVAPVGGVIVGERAHGLTAEAFDFDEVEPVEVKGKAKPLHIWVARSARSRFGAEMLDRSSTPMVDREDELELLKRTFARAVREPSVQLVTLMGEPGVGKSRVIREFFTYLDDLPEVIAWRQGRSLSYGEGVTFWALGQVVKAQAGILESDDAAEARAKLTATVEAVVDDPGERGWVRGRLAPLIGLDEPQSEGADRTEAFSAWRRFLEAVAAHWPLVVVLEDLHWADDALLAFVEYLVEWSVGPMLILCSARPELFDRVPNWGGGTRNASTVSLAPLSETDTRSLVASLLPAETVSAVGGALIERAGGNPLFAEELARMFVGPAGGGDPEITPPESLQALIAARLDTLPVEQKFLLQDASVVGKVFWSGALAAIGGADPADVEARLHELVRSELVRRSRESSIRDQHEYAFSHALIRDVAYGQIPREPRAAKHVAAAAWIEGIAGERVSDKAEVLAFHHDRALELLRSAGRTDVGDLEDATRRYWVMAGERQMSLDVDSAYASFGRALATLPAEAPERAAILAAQAEASFYRGRYPEARAAYEEVIAAARANGDRLVAGAAENWLATVRWEQGDTAGSRELLAQAVADLEAEPPGPELADCYASIASDHLLTGHFEEAIEVSERALELVGKLGAEASRPRALSYRGMSRCYLGDLGGLDDLREARELTERLGLSRENARVLLILAEVLWAAEGPAPALEATAAGAALAEHRALSEMLVGCWTTSLGPLFDAGEWDELLRIADDVLRHADEVGGRYAAGLTTPWRTQVLLWRGRLDEARAAAEDLVVVGRELRDAQVVVPAFVTAGLVALRDGRPQDALAIVAELEAMTEIRLDWYLEGSIADLVRLCIAAGDVDAARRLLERARTFTRRHLLSVATARAALAEADGDDEGAAARFDEAAEGWADYGHVPATGGALLGAARCLGRLGRAEAAHRRARAREVFAGLGADPLVAEVDRLSG